jgi:hypothetical protein
LPAQCLFSGGFATQVEAIEKAISAQTEKSAIHTLGLGCVKTSDEGAKCYFGLTVEISASMKSMA